MAFSVNGKVVSILSVFLSAINPSLSPCVCLSPFSSSLSLCYCTSHKIVTLIQVSLVANLLPSQAKMPKRANPIVMLHTCWLHLVHNTAAEATLQLLSLYMYWLDHHLCWWLITSTCLNVWLLLFLYNLSGCRTTIQHWSLPYGWNNGISLGNVLSSKPN